MSRPINSNSPLTQDEIQQLIRGTGIYDPDDLPSGFHSKVAAVTQENRGLFVRGAKSGGSPMLNVLSNVAFWLTSLVLVGMVVLLFWGGSLIYNAWFRTSEETRLVAAPGEIVCTPEETMAALPSARAAQIAGGEMDPPFSAEEAAAVNGSILQVGQDRAVVFPVQGGRIGVLYEGETERVKSISLEFSTPIQLCRAIQAGGLLPGVAKFRQDANGGLVATGGEVAPVLKKGALLQFRGSPDAVKTVQITPPAR